MRRNRAAYARIAQLHIDNINQGFLAQLGPDFLALMYACIDDDPGALLLTCEREGEIVGFVTSAASLGGVYRRMLWRWWRLVPALTPVLVKPRRLRRIGEILLYSMASPEQADLPPTELLSLAVAAPWRGQGCAEELYRALMAALRGRGASGFRIVVGAALDPAHRFYKRMGAEPVAEIELHRGERSTVYIHRLG